MQQELRDLALVDPVQALRHDVCEHGQLHRLGGSTRSVSYQIPSSTSLSRRDGRRRVRQRLQGDGLDHGQRLRLDGLDEQRRQQEDAAGGAYYGVGLDGGEAADEGGLHVVGHVAEVVRVVGRQFVEAGRRRR